MSTNKPLNDRQLLFCREYCVTQNAEEAYKLAGYSHKGAHASAYKLLQDPRIQAEIDRIKQKASARTNVTLDTLISNAEAIYKDAIQVVERNGKESMLSRTDAIKANEQLAKLTGNYKNDHRINGNIGVTIIGEDDLED